MRPLLPLLLLLGALALGAAPTAAADHCAAMPLAEEAQCEARHAEEATREFVLCFYNTAPAKWFVICVPPPF